MDQGEVVTQPEATTTNDAGYAVRMTGVSKSFGGVKALQDVHLEVKAGEVHALLGGNGAGKSTILKILRGVHAPDSGTIEVNGKEMTAHTPVEARAAGIAMIFQEMSLIPTLTVAQNIFLNNENKDAYGFIDDRTAVRRARELFASFGVAVDPNTLASDIGAGPRQLTEIMKAISQKCSVLVLDEPSTALSAEDVDKLFDFIRKLKADGVAIIYVSHRMDEIGRIADRATILRDGRHVITADMAGLTLDSIIEHIVGKQSKGLSGIDRTGTRRGDPLLELKDLSGREKPRNVNLTLYAGEVVGVSGLLGSGRSALARVLFGIDPKTAGEVRIAGKLVDIKNPKDAIAEGMALVPEDRLRQGIVALHSVKANIGMSVLDRISHRGWMSAAKSDDLARKNIEQLRIKTDGPDAGLVTLSGGNQQKVVLGKWLATSPRILILDEPTAGIDIASKSEIVALVRRLASEGKAILMISSELTELLAACDRILILSDGRVLRDMSRHEFDDPAHQEHAPTSDLQFAERKLQLTLQEVRLNG